MRKASDVPVRALLDVNVIIALLDPDHVFHENAHVWWAANFRKGWASCPITENGVIRVMSNPGYSQKVRFAPGDLIVRLREFVSAGDHAFWPDDVSLLDSELFDSTRIHGSKQLTDIYLLALATAHGGKLVTFDRGLAQSVVPPAGPENLCVI